MKDYWKDLNFQIFFLPKTNDWCSAILTAVLSSTSKSCFSDSVIEAVNDSFDLFFPISMNPLASVGILSINAVGASSYFESANKA